MLDAAGSRAVAAYALHVTSALLPAGTFATRAGPLLASASVLRVRVAGRGGHGSAPHRAADPVQAACAMVTALQTYVTREVDVFDPVVVTVGRFAAGTQFNIIPDIAEFDATVRAFSAERQDRLVVDLPRVCRAVASAHQVDVEAVVEPMYPVTVNERQAATAALKTAARLFGEERVRELPNPLAGSEDFSRVLDAVPGAMVMLGATPPGRDPARAPFNHAPEADFDERVMGDGAQLYAELAVAALSTA